MSTKMHPSSTAMQTPPRMAAVEKTPGGKPTQAHPPQTWPRVVPAAHPLSNSASQYSGSPAPTTQAPSNRPASGLPVRPLKRQQVYNPLQAAKHAADRVANQQANLKSKYSLYDKEVPVMPRKKVRSEDMEISSK